MSNYSINHVPKQNEEEFNIWLTKQEELKKNIKEVCSKYSGTSMDLRSNSLPIGSLMYDSKHQLLFCRNAKVSISYDKQA